MNNKPKILIVDDEQSVQQSFEMVLKDDNDVHFASTGEEALEILSKNSIDIILLDIRLPDINGIDLLGKIKEIDPSVEVIMVTAVNDIQSAVKAIKLGAFEYVSKPFIVDEVLALIDRANEKRRLVREVVYLRNELERFHPFEKIVGEAPSMKKIYGFISTISESDGNVLIQGESGTGKELVSRAIHNRSLRKNGPFVVINCAAIPETLMESKLFGHDKGAFTGATQASEGKLSIADKGTVFLDDIDLLDVNMQAKLLRAIQEKEFERLGSSKVINVDVRFIAACNKKLDKMISEGNFREDLFYRLNVFPIKIPPLRKRKSDIPLLLDYFLDQNAEKTGKPLKYFSQNAINNLLKYEWPGNVRELQNLVERSFIIAKGPIIHLKDIVIFEIGNKSIETMPLKDAVSYFERQYIEDILASVNGSRKKAADILGIHRNTLLTKINELGLYD